jgi:hypothetical protein
MALAGAVRRGKLRGGSCATRPRPSHIPPLGPAIDKRVVALTMASTLGTRKPVRLGKSDPAARLRLKTSRKFGLV